MLRWLSSILCTTLVDKTVDKLFGDIKEGNEFFALDALPISRAKSSGL
jgi:hypothetical protein